MSDTTDELVPILRVENADKAAQWYSRLGFVLEGVHRFGPGSGSAERRPITSEKGAPIGA